MATLVKSALLNLRRPASSRAFSVVSERLCAPALHPAVLMAAPSRLNVLAPTPMVFETPMTQVQINDVLPTLADLECPAESLNEPLQAVKRTYQPSVLRRKRKHGFRTRRVSISGRKVLKRRFNKGRWRMSL